MRIVTLMLLAALLPPAALGQDKDKLKPCTLLTAADAASIMGVSMPVVDQGKDNCTYGVLGAKVPGHGNAVDRSVGLSITKYKNTQAADKAWHQGDDAANREPIRVLSGIGDAALLHGGAPAVFTALTVRKGALTFGLLIFDKQGNYSDEAAIAVAKKIADQF